LRKIDHGYDATNRTAAIAMLQEARARHELMTGLLYVHTSVRDLCERENLVDEPLRDLSEADLRISREYWTRMMESS